MADAMADIVAAGRRQESGTNVGAVQPVTIDESSATIAVAAKVSPAVVRITVTGTTQDGNNGVIGGFHRRGDKHCWALDLLARLRAADGGLEDHLKYSHLSDPHCWASQFPCSAA